MTNVDSEREALRGTTATDPAVHALARTLALSDGFALQLVVCESECQARLAIEVAGRLCAGLREAETQTLRIDPYDSLTEPGRVLDARRLVEQVLSSLLAPSDGSVHVIGWLDATRAPAPQGTEETGRDDHAWRELFRRMNERRNTIARDFGAPLTLIAPPRLIRAFAEEAPDFWSIRSLSVHLAVAPGSGL